MARIYDSNENNYGAQYQGSARSVAFSPVQAADASRREEQRAQREQANLRLEQQSLNRKQTIEKGQLQTQQTIENAELAYEQAGDKSKLNTINGLVKLSGTFAKGVGDYLVTKAENVEKQEQLDLASSWINGGGTVLDYDNNGGVQVVPNENPGTKATDTASGNTDVNVQVAAVESGITQTTDDPEEQELLRQPSADLQADNNREKVNVYTAATNIYAVVADFLDSDTQVRLPNGEIITANGARNRQELTAVAMAAIKQYAADNGLTASGPGQQAFVETFLPAAQNAVAREVSSRSAGIRDAAQNGRLRDAQEAAVTGLETNAPGSIQTAWKTLSDSYFGSGKYKGDRTKSNDAAIAFLTDYLISKGDVEGIKKLGESSKFTDAQGNKGPKLSTTYATLLNKAEREARRVRSGDRREAAGEATASLQEANNTFLTAITTATTPEEVEAAHRAYESTLKNLGTPEATEEWLKQQGIPNSRNPLAYGDLVDRIAGGEVISQAEINEAIGSGVISVTQGRELSNMNGAGLEAQTAAIKPVQTQVKALAEAAAAGVLSTKGVPPEAKRPAAVAISADLTTRINSYLTDLLKSDPEMTSGQLTAAAESWIKSNSPALLANVNWNKETYSVEGYTYAGTQSTASATTTRWVNPQTGKKGVVLTNLSVQQMGSLQFDNNLDNDIDPTTDRLLKTEEMSLSLQAIINGDIDSVPPRVKAIADLLEVTPQYLIAEQAKAQGLPNAAEVSKAVTYDPSRSFGQEGPRNKEEGVAYFRQQGFSPKGSAMLSANIQSESSWNGSRDWGQVAGDGTSRNGGLVSWAQWSDNPARLGAAEAYIGKPISQSTHAEQLEFMLYEMKQSYPDVWRIMRNPNATDAQLRRAAKAYWGYGIEGDRFRFYENLAYG